MEVALGKSTKTSRGVVGHQDISLHVLILSRECVSPLSNEFTSHPFHGVCGSTNWGIFFKVK